MTFSEQFPIVLQALNVGFLQTLKLFAVTLIGAIPLGLVISFGSMSSWAPLGFLRPYVMKNGTPTERLTGWQRFQLWWVVDFKPIRLLARLSSDRPRLAAVLQLLIIYYFPRWCAGTTSGARRGRALPRLVDRVRVQLCLLFLRDLPRRHPGVPKGQQEAGQVLGMTKTQIFFKVTLLQMVKRIVPPMSNEIITLVKDTSSSRIIALQEVIWAGQAFMKGSHGIAGAIWPLFFTGVYYLIFSGILTLVLGRVEKKLDYFKA